MKDDRTYIVTKSELDKNEIYSRLLGLYNIEETLDIIESAMISNFHSDGKGVIVKYNSKTKLFTIITSSKYEFLVK